MSGLEQNTDKIVRIGGGAGFWGDTPEGPVQLINSGQIDYLMLDYLAEITMSILARMKAKNSNLGYATDFVNKVAAPLAEQVAQQNIKIITNAGGVNPQACAAALRDVFSKSGVDLKIALVEGDDLLHRLDDYRAAQITEMFSKRPMPQNIVSMNAYLGAMPIARALEAGADIVVCGRCVDSALALGPLIYEFGWQADAYDCLSSGSLIGHLLECGTQVTGGIFTDWRDVEGWDNMGFPIAHCFADGSFELTKPEGTGGLVSMKTVAEQVVYEVGDPTDYKLPDVTCDWSNIKLSASGQNRVKVFGAKGSAPSGTYKVSATYADGYRALVTLMIGGREAVAKAEAVGAAILKRSERLMQEAGHAGFQETSIETLGAESTYGAHARARASREVVLKIAVRHGEKEALNIFAQEIYPAATAMAQGITGFASGRPAPQPVIRLFSFLADKADITITLDVEGQKTVLEYGSSGSNSSLSNSPLHASASVAPAAISSAVSSIMSSVADEDGGMDEAQTEIPLIALAHGRSGDKGDNANIGILARDPAFVPIIRKNLTPETVADYLKHIVLGDVERFEWPGLNGFNFVLHRALGGGGVASLRHDPQGKAFAQMLLDIPISVPTKWLSSDGLLAHWKGTQT